MSEFAIRTHGLSKAYHIAALQQPYQTLRDSVTNALKGSFHRLTGSNVSTSRDNVVWALRDASFTVRNGEVVGIIGYNGAGKSTLLKILSRVTEPTRGFVEIRGRVGSLLEVGTGFHPELTGRENVFLNGAILGMKKKEILGKFDRIVEFSGISEYIDTPVKYYSSGMYLRLAFAVAAYFEPDILLVDEVLAVGDLDFQKRCLGRMSEVARQGRTVLFVSHNLTAISSLTERCILLRNGRIVKFGNTDEIVRLYHASVNSSQTILSERKDRTGTGQLRFTAIQILDGATAQPTSSVVSGQHLTIRLHWVCHEQLSSGQVAMDIRFKDSLGVPVASVSTRFSPWKGGLLPHQGSSECFIPSLPLAPDDYLLDIWAGVNNRQADYLGNAASLAVRYADYFGTNQMPQIRKHGGFLIQHSWKLNSSTETPEPLFGG